MQAVIKLICEFIVYLCIIFLLVALYTYLKAYCYMTIDHEMVLHEG
jgi:hypothetical protein